MMLYAAPMEGITGYLFRNTFDRYFGNSIDKYFSPFIMSHEKIGMSNKEIADVLPEHNSELKLIPQVMTNSASEYLQIEETLTDFGYDEINLNCGCPSKTVVTKKRGAGILNDTDMLDRMLYGIFEKSKVSISVKTRIGFVSTDEYFDLISIYNKYDLKELIVHPRLQNEYYAGVPHYDIYKEIEKSSKNTLIYNGNVFSVVDYQRITGEIISEKTDGVMLGRGLIGNPFLAGMISDGTVPDKKTLLMFLEELTQVYEDNFSGDLPVLFKMKEIWGMINHEDMIYDSIFEFDKKDLKKLKKCSSLNEFKTIQNMLLE